MALERRDIEAVKERLEIVQLVQRYVQLRQVGERYSGVCPFHQETKPSLSVSPSLGAFYCFGCQASGDAIEFYRRINGLEFREALRDLAEEAGVPLRKGGSPEEDAQKRSLRRLCFEMHSVAAAYFQSELAGPRGEQARKYLQETRGISSEIGREFQLGYSPDAWEGLKRKLQQSGYTPQQGVEAGLLSQNRQGRIYDRFRSRILFPIHDLSGRVIAFGGRAIGDVEPKYLNSSDTPIFKKSEHLYGLYQARKAVTQSGEVLLTEGYSDVLTLVQHGFPNSCGVLGTALSGSQVRRLAGLCNRVILVFDGDRAGVQAAQRSAELVLQQGLSAHVINLPSEEDVDSYLRKLGSDSFRELKEQSLEGLAFCLSMIKSTSAPREIMNWATSFLSNLGQRSWQAFYLPRVAEGLNISERELRNAVLGKTSVSLGSRGGDAGPQAGSPARLDKEFLRFAVRNPSYIQEMERLGLGEVLRTERGRQFWSKLLEYGMNGVEPYLDEGERQFFIQSRITAREDEDVSTVWADLRERVLGIKERKWRSELQEALRQAQLRGDRREMQRILQKLSQSTKGAG